MKQQRNTKQRQLILEAVRERHDHPTADQLYLDVRALDGKVSRGTVYRNLNLLAQNGEVLIVRVPGADRFDCRLEQHYHLLCTACAKVCDVALPYRAELDSEIAQATGYVIQRHCVICEGLCPECQRAQAAETG